MIHINQDSDFSLNTNEENVPEFKYSFDEAGDLHVVSSLPPENLKKRIELLYDCKYNELCLSVLKLETLLDNISCLIKDLRTYPDYADMVQEHINKSNLICQSFVQEQILREYEFNSKN